MRASPQSTPKPARRPGQNGKDNLIPISDEQAKLAQEIVGAGRDVRIPMKSAMHSNMMSATCSDLKPATIPK
jgi:hypothetical protein